MTDIRIWRFYCEAYEGKEAEFLRLQDDFGLQISMLLFCGWYGGRNFSIDNMEDLVAVADEQDEILFCVRLLRKRLKGEYPQAYEVCKRLELEIERYCLAELFSHVLVSEGGTVSSNIESYLSLKGRLDSPIEDIVNHLEEISDGSA